MSGGPPASFVDSCRRRKQRDDAFALNLGYINHEHRRLHLAGAEKANGWRLPPPVAKSGEPLRGGASLRFVQALPLQEQRDGGLGISGADSLRAGIRGVRIGVDFLSRFGAAVSRQRRWNLVLGCQRGGTSSIFAVQSEAPGLFYLPVSGILWQS